MSFEIYHFHDSDKILKNKKINSDIITTLQYLDDVLAGSIYKRELFRQALSEMDWIQGNGDMKILENRRYQYKGFKRGVAIDGNFSAYEYLIEGSMRLQLGFDKGKIDTGVLILNAKRSEKSPYGNTSDMVKEDIEMLTPTINLPISVALFNLDNSVISDGN